MVSLYVYVSNSFQIILKFICGFLICCLFDVAIQKVPIIGHINGSDQNYLTSSGSVIDIFHAQICNGDFTIRI
jgi:hypothetical protein